VSFHSRRIPRQEPRLHLGLGHDGNTRVVEPPPHQIFEAHRVEGEFLDSEDVSDQIAIEETSVPCWRRSDLRPDPQAELYELRARHIRAVRCDRVKLVEVVDDAFREFRSEAGKVDSRAKSRYQATRIVISVVNSRLIVI
jgi:hypothetical protein